MTLTIGRRILATMIVLISAIPAAAEYPDRAINLIVPFAPGGGSDTFARTMKKAIDDHHLLPQPLVIINVKGAGGTIGSRRVKDAQPDGYTVLLLHEAIITAKHWGNVDYGPEAFEPVAGTGDNGTVITVGPESPYTDLRELLNAAKAAPQTISFGANFGAPSHFTGLLLEETSPGAAFRFVKTGGGADRYGKVKGGHVDVTAFSIEEFLRFREDGLRGLAILDPQRNRAIADVPTAVEQNVPLTYSLMQYWWVPRGTPQDRIDLLTEALRKAINTDYVRKQLAQGHIAPVFLRGQPLTDRLQVIDAQVSKVEIRDPDDLPDVATIALVIVLALGIVALVRARRQRHTGRSALPTTRSPTSAFSERPRLALTVILLTVVYVAALSTNVVGFRPATIGFVLTGGLLLTDRRSKMFPAIVVTALAVGLGVHGLFTKVFFIDLP